MLADPELDIAGSDLVVVTRRHDVVVGRGGGDTTKACRGAASAQGTRGGGARVLVLQEKMVAVQLVIASWKALPAAWRGSPLSSREGFKCPLHSALKHFQEWPNLTLTIMMVVRVQGGQLHM